jgi:sugar lactone lactonase YvrE
MKTRLSLITMTAALAAAALVVHASAPIFWQVSTRADFLRGEVDNLSLDSDGRLALGPVTETVFDASAPFLWTLAAGPGGSVYAGSGNEGKVYRVGRDGKATTFYDAAEMEVHALAPAPGGGLFVATSPNGRIYKVDAAGTAVPFFDPEDKYVWSLAVDSAGFLYAGTGEKGAIYRIGPDSKGKLFYATKATNVMALTFDPAGNLLAGTDSPGRVFRIDKEGKASVLLDSELKEIRAIQVAGDGVLYVAAVSGSRPAEDRATEAGATAAPRPTPVPTVTTEISGIAIIDTSAQAGGDAKAGTSRAQAGTAKGAVYRIQPDGLWDVVWDSTDELPYDLALERDGSLLVGTGAKGRIFRISGEPPRATLVGRVTAQQVTRFLSGEGEQLYVATANPGKLAMLGPSRAARGTFESEVRDAQTVSAWGAISWKARTPAGSQLELFTRSGNSQPPDDTWSPWSGPYRNPDGDQILSPKGRYLQWKAVFSGSGATAVLTSVTAAYLQRNLRPTVASITVHPAGTVFQKPYSTGELEIAGYDNTATDLKASAASAAVAPGVTVSQGPALGRRTYQKGLQTIQWKADDGNDDKLEYDIQYRLESETTWKTLKRGLTDTIFVWDTTTVPNGTYVIRVVASDIPSNPPGQGLTGDLDSTPFGIDNTPPSIRVTNVRKGAGKTVVSFEVHDEQSVIQRVDFSVDAERWRPVYPKDGICDSRLEQFELVLDGDVAAGSVVIRAVDAMNNTATARADRGAPETGTPSSGRRQLSPIKKDGD